MLINIFNGMVMALADSVPGVSGGTIAFILGFYDKFIDNLHEFFEGKMGKRWDSFKYLFNLGLGWIFGLLLSIFFLSELFQREIYFMSSVFLGLTLMSLPFLIQSEKKILRENKKDFYFIFIGIIIVVFLVYFKEKSRLIGDFDLINPNMFDYIYLFFAGAFAISAMVLPGISGSSILLIAGVYIPIVEAFGEVMRFNFEKILPIIVMSLGIIFGIFMSIRIIREKMRKNRDKMIYLILGMIVGSLFAIIMGPTTVGKNLPLNFDNFSLSGFIIGIFILFVLEVIRIIRIKKEKKTWEN
ncbi:DUF368 domain-containing protein [Peptoniphilus phoceensis]|uniref:DUF368 domain-containing protein n=1 Tax=Peptoniphilus phoceensis TaxID=1720298 RepID=UPI0007854D07|nr:DUF368 domain-containing protein [Peptoniphilus phoceensis]